jgi:acyl-CoA synthetase (AMP-forming)/AMP-acid ligase II
MARQRPDAVAVVEALGYDRRGRRQYRHVTFRELDDDSNRVAAGLRWMGVIPGTRLVLLVRAGIDFISLVLALFKAGAVVVLIDPGMGRRNLIKCLSDAEPQGFVALPIVHAVRCLLRRRFPASRFHITVGRRWFWGGTTLRELRGQPPADFEPAATRAGDPAAIIFTTGSTGPPKGVLFTHGNFDAQVEEIRDRFGIRPGEVDLPAFPLFGLFNCAMGVTAVLPDMDPTRPAQVDPARIVEAIRDWSVTQAFGSPAVWRRVGPYCRDRGIRLPTVRRVLSAGAPVPVHVLQNMKDCIHPDGDVYTPYGATEALPVASISASEVLGETAEMTRQGAGVCVGHRFPRIEWKVIRIVDGPIREMQQAEELPTGEIGELIVRGPVVTRRYVTRIEANALGKIPDGQDIWHRMGDAGYLDRQERFWFCGRLAHRVLTADGPMYTIPCEAIFNQHADVERSALVGVGPAGQQRPVIVLELRPGRMPRAKGSLLERLGVHPNMGRIANPSYKPDMRARREEPADTDSVPQKALATLLEEIRQLGRANPVTSRIDDFLLHPAFPVDIRHNAKIFREKLAVWAARQLR